MTEDMYEKAIRNFIDGCPGQEEAAQAIALAMLADAVKNGCAMLVSVGLRKALEAHEARWENTEQIREQLKREEKR